MRSRPITMVLKDRTSQVHMAALAPFCSDCVYQAYRLGACGHDHLSFAPEEAVRW